jgi:hypothetical protein
VIIKGIILDILVPLLRWHIYWIDIYSLQMQASIPNKYFTILALSNMIYNDITIIGTTRAVLGSDYMGKSGVEIKDVQISQGIIITIIILSNLIHNSS